MDLTMVDESTGDLTKGGETSLWLTIGRSPRHPEGIVVRVKALPSIEAYMRSLAIPTDPEPGPDGNPDPDPQPIIQDVVLQGRNWTSITNEPLRAYWHNSPPNMPGVRLDRLARPLITLDGDGDGNISSASMKRRGVNLSFLRLVGISEGAGVGFVVRGVYSESQIKEIHSELLQGIRQFYIQYLKPINMEIQVSSQVIS